MFTDSQHLVMSILKVDQAHYAEIIYCHGVTQIAQLLPGLTSLDDLESSEPFWTDFKQRWATGDQEFIDTLSVDQIEALINAKECSGEAYDCWISFHRFTTLETLPVGVQRVVLNQLAKEQNARATAAIKR